MTLGSRSRSLLSEASGSVADLGIFVPIAAALVLNNGLDPATVLVFAGALYVAAGLYFGVPVPVQPIKAAAAIAIARDLPPESIAAAGMTLGVIMVVVGITGAAAFLNRVFAEPIVRGLQLGVGLILLRTALGLAAGSSEAGVYAVAAVVGAVLVATFTTAERWPVALLIVVAGVAYSLITSPNPALPFAPSLWRPDFLSGVFEPSVMWASFTLLVIPQIPLTFGNAVVAVTDLEHRYFGARSRRVNPMSVSLSCGTANIVAAAMGGMPMCHGSSGLTAHFRAGARSAAMNVIIGGALLTLGLVFGSTAFGLLTLIPLAVLMGLLMFAGVMHSSLVADLRGYELAIGITMGVAGFWTSNLSIALMIGLTMFWPVRWARGASRGPGEAASTTQTTGVAESTEP